MTDDKPFFDTNVLIYLLQNMHLQKTMRERTQPSPFSPEAA
jgi:predicted nucleic acid-binding protein